MTTTKGGLGSTPQELPKKHSMLDEARRLHDLGLGVHWIKAGSKAPVKSRWTTPPRDDWKTVKGEYQEGYGLGVVLGEHSKISDGFYLANIDVDLKSSSPEHRGEVETLLEERFPGLLASAPKVTTGYGFRLFIKTRTPLRSGKISSSPDEVKVLLPTSEVNRRQTKAVEEGLLTEEELKDGWRLRHAWEVEFMSLGKQVVLPPSLHPDTGKRYAWGKSFSSVEDIPLVEAGDFGVSQSRGRPPGVGTVQKFEPVEVDLVSSTLPDRIVDQIMSGRDVEDRSAACFGVCISMLKHGFKDQEILSVLTDRSYYLGETAYDHRHTTSRAAAAAWVRDYCLRKAKEATSAARDFQNEVTVEELSDDEDKDELTAEEAVLQKKALLAERPWQERLKRGGKDGEGNIKNIPQNVVLILENTTAGDVFKFDRFSLREFYSRDVPWREGRKGKNVDNSDAVCIKLWLSQKFNFDAGVPTIYEAMTWMCEKNSFHPVIDELESLPVWDGVNRLDTWLEKHFEAQGDAEYLAQVMRKWLVASITRVYQPGAKFDWMPIFEGSQGVGKSSFGSMLFRQKYFRDSLPPLNDAKEAALALQGSLCVEFGELDSLRRSEVDTIKAFVTRQVDKVRPPYERKSIEIGRSCVFFGTTNRDNYLKDDTGNRRFNPVKVGKLDFAALKRDREQLWAEALFIFKNDLEPSLYLQGGAAVFAKEAQEEKVAPDNSQLMLETLLEYLEKAKLNAEEGIKFNFLTFSCGDLFKEWAPLARDWKKDIHNCRLAAKAVRQIPKLNPSYLLSEKKVHQRVVFSLAPKGREQPPL